MDLILVMLQCALSIVLVVAGVAKLADLSGSRRAVREFGVPQPLSEVLGTALPVAEIVIAIGFLSGAAARWAALAATGLFLLFAVVIGWNASRGRHPDCHCFGQLQSSPAGWSTVIRNVSMAVGAGIIAWQGGRSLNVGFNKLSATTLSGLLLGVVIFGAFSVTLWLMLQLWQQNGRLLLRVEALEAATTVSGIKPDLASAQPALVRVASGFDLPTIDGGRITLGNLQNAPRPTLLVFTDPNCGPCNQLLPDVGKWHREHDDALRIVLISQGSVEENLAKGQEHGIPTIAIQEDREVAKAFGVNGTPAAVLVHPDGVIREPMAAGAAAIRTLVARHVGEVELPTIPMQPSMPGMNGNGVQSASQDHAPKRLGADDKAPHFALPDLDDTIVTLDEIQGRDTVLLFWNPGCGFCRRMLPDIQRWEAQDLEGAPELLIISTGSVQSNRDMELQSTVLIDGGFKTGRAYGAVGTPSAVLVDREGTIASPMVVGGPAIMQLLAAPVETETSNMLAQ